MQLQDPVIRAIQSSVSGRWDLARAQWIELARHRDRPLYTLYFLAEASLKTGDFDRAAWCRTLIEMDDSLPDHLQTLFDEAEPLRLARKDWHARKEAGKLVSDPAERAREMIRLRLYRGALEAALQVNVDRVAAELAGEVRSKLGLGAIVDGVASYPPDGEDTEWRAHPLARFLKSAANVSESH